MNWELMFKMEREVNNDLMVEKDYYYQQSQKLEKILNDYKLELCRYDDELSNLYEEVDILSGENKNFANFLTRLGLDDEQISNIANGGDYEIVSNITIYV